MPNDLLLNKIITIIEVPKIEQLMKNHGLSQRQVERKKIVARTKGKGKLIHQVIKMENQRLKHSWNTYIQMVLARTVISSPCLKEIVLIKVQMLISMILLDLKVSRRLSKK